MGFMDNRLHDIKKLGNNTRKYSDIKPHLHDHQPVPKEAVDSATNKDDSAPDNNSKL